MTLLETPGAVVDRDTLMRRVWPGRIVEEHVLWIQVIVEGLGACRKAGFAPVIGQVAPHMASIITLVAAEPGVSIVPASGDAIG